MMIQCHFNNWISHGYHIVHIYDYSVKLQFYVKVPGVRESNKPTWRGEIKETHGFMLYSCCFCHILFFLKLLIVTRAKKVWNKLKEDFEESTQKKEKFSSCHYCKKPIILKKIAGPKIINFFVVIIVIRMVILRAIIVPRKTKQTDNLHNKKIVQKIKRKIQNICMSLLMWIMKQIWFH